MKKLTTAAFLILPLALLAQKNEFTIRGKLGDVGPPAKIYLVNAESKAVLDSVFVTEGAFKFIGEVDAPIPAYLTLNKNDSGFRNSKESKFFYLEKGLITVNESSGKLGEAIVTGTPNNAANTEYNQIDKRIMSLSEKIEEKKNAAGADQQQSEVLKKEIEKLEKARMDEGKKAYLQFVRSHRNAMISLMALTELIYVEDHTKVAAAYKTLTSELKNSPKGKQLGDQLAARQKIEIGSFAPIFSMPDTSDNIVSLSSLAGKYVLLDMWASWCAPCREENPNLVKAYQAYKDKNFTILGVSLDTESDKNKWLAAIKKDRLEWTQLSDLKGWDNEAAKLYGVAGIPQNFLIDPSGKIIAMNLRGDELANKLAETLGNKN
ncbi:TlpA disulfide reductase family protein [Dyadobacter bucti]|uniref:TlpA disulfide reductase family protein n=1 Tax=Dyadobacter bucti TaxID=2572203 RepID=UPI001109642F|nr:TlpA disulfide reductase family protein [Dyadobacter bucti]